MAKQEHVRVRGLAKSLEEDAKAVVMVDGYFSAGMAAWEAMSRKRAHCASV
jgi:hypothetical protein